jgi:hypothetical protein
VLTPPAPELELPPRPPLTPETATGVEDLEAEGGRFDGAREPAEGCGDSPLFSLALCPALALDDGAAVVAVDEVEVFGW